MNAKFDKDLIEFRGAIIPKQDKLALEELENKIEEKFYLDKNFSLEDWHHYGSSIFSIENNRVVLVAVRDNRECEDCNQETKTCDSCGLASLPESVGNLTALKELYIVCIQPHGLIDFPDSFKLSKID